MIGIRVLIVTFSCLALTFADSLLEEETGNARYTIEGKLVSDQIITAPNWQANTRIVVNGGEFLGFVKEDGSFLVHNVPPGSYIVEALNPRLNYEPVRVEINSKGKFRARKVNHIQTALVIQVPYPLRMKPLGFNQYFQIREQWMFTDILFSPMLFGIVVPLLFIMVLPKMMNDPETKKELEQIGNMTKLDDVGDMVTKFLAGSPQQQQQQQQQQQKKNAKAKKRQ